MMSRGEQDRFRKSEQLVVQNFQLARDAVARMDLQRPVLGDFCSRGTGGAQSENIALDLSRLRFSSRCHEIFTVCAWRKIDQQIQVIARDFAVLEQQRIFRRVLFGSEIKQVRIELGSRLLATRLQVAPPFRRGLQGKRCTGQRVANSCNSRRYDGGSVPNTETRSGDGAFLLMPRSVSLPTQPDSAPGGAGQLAPEQRLPVILLTRVQRKIISGRKTR
jgi:hypothetical protein